jgi:hypothetical protein
VTKNTLPTYAIVELLIRLSHTNPAIGDYKDHLFRQDGVIVKTTFGSILFSKALIVKQFESPELITSAELAAVALQFKPLK